ncbi:hypothetical protein KR084_001582, partial [Drosophila pseudotakahashii]
RSGPKYQTDDYYTYEGIQEYLKGLADTYSNRVKLTDIGKTYENRTLTTITISNGDGRKGKNVIFIDAGFHAREWLTHTAALNIIDQLVVNFRENQELLKDYDWVILPLVNADGYTFSRSGTVFINETITCNDHEIKCWRKNRKPAAKGCIGTDLNRNFDYDWGIGDHLNNPCSITYKGLSPFSESESQAVKRVLFNLVNSGRGILYLTFHSAISLILYPWGSSRDNAKNLKEHQEIAEAGIEAIAERNFQFPSNYTTRSSYDLYPAGGTSSDYAYKIGFPLSFTWELKEARGNLKFNFHPPTYLIKELVEETWIGMRAMAKKVIEKYPKNR